MVYNKTINTSCAYVELSSKQEQFIDDFFWWIEICGNLPVSLVGVVLNCITLIVLSTPTMRINFFNRLLICLAISDNIYLLCEVSEVFRHRYHTYVQQHAFINIVYPIRSIFMCSSIYLPLALAMERYNAIKSPMKYRNRATHDTVKQLMWYVMPVLTFSTIYYIPRFFDLDIKEFLKCDNGVTTINDTKEYNTTDFAEKNCTNEYHLIPTKLRVDNHYVLWYINISNILLTYLIPVGILIYINCKIRSSLQKFMARRPSMTQVQPTSRPHPTNDKMKVFILFAIVFILIICHSLRVVLNIEEFIDLTRFKEQEKRGCNSRKFWKALFVRISQLLIIMNSSINFFIYVYMDKGFQKVLRNGLCLRRDAQTNNMKIRKSVRTTETLNERLTSNTNDIELLNINHNNN